MSPSLIAIDWGSTNCRAALLDQAGIIIDQKDGGAGIFDRGGTSFVGQLNDIIAPWRAAQGLLPVILSGMVGSRNGLIEIPYVTCPATAGNVAAALHKLNPAVAEQCWIVPGLRGQTPDNVADVMRGEEVQVFGLLDQPGWECGDALVILPGTHSKWVLLRDGAIYRFATAASGELFATLSTQGSLAPLLDIAPDRGFDSTQFQSGLTHARQPGGLLHHIFNLRARAVLGEIPTEHLRTRLSALLIGHELKEMLSMFPAAPKVAVVGNALLGQFYCEAMADRGIKATWHNGSEAAAHGMFLLAKAADILETMS